MKRIFALALLTAASVWGQCVMCQRTAAAQNLARQRILNTGILVMLAPPVLILAGFLALAYRRSGPSGPPGAADGDPKS